MSAFTCGVVEVHLVPHTCGVVKVHLVPHTCGVVEVHLVANMVPIMAITANISGKGGQILQVNHVNDEVQPHRQKLIIAVHDEDTAHGVSILNCGPPSCGCLKASTGLYYTIHFLKSFCITASMANSSRNDGRC